MIRESRFYCFLCNQNLICWALEQFLSLFGFLITRVTTIQESFSLFFVLDPRFGFYTIRMCENLSLGVNHISFTIYCINYNGYNFQLLFSFSPPAFFIFFFALDLFKHLLYFGCSNFHYLGVWYHFRCFGHLLSRRTQFWF